MKITITGKDFKLTSAIKTHIAEHAEKIAKFRRDVQGVQFELASDQHHQKGERFVVEGWVYLPGKQDIFASAQDFDLYVAIDAVVKKLSRQVEKTKEKLIDRKRRNG